LDNPEFLYPILDAFIYSADFSELVADEISEINKN
jgi:hypothetical protein